MPALNNFESIRPFYAWSQPHLGALLLILAAVVFAYLLGRRIPARWRPWATGGYAAVWGGLELYWVLSTIGLCERTRDCLPLHLCDISIFMLILALLTHRRWAFEFSYFFGIGGTLQALLTPDLSESWPNEIFVRFFVGHGGIIVGVLLLASAYSMRPYPRSILRVFGYGLIYMVLAFLFNWVMDTNYGYVCRKPDQPSLLDKLGPWPWYVIWAQVIIMANLLILYLPFFLNDVRKRRRPHSAQVADGT